MFHRWVKEYPNVNTQVEYDNGFMFLVQKVDGCAQIGILIEDKEDAEELIETLKMWLATNPRSRNE